VLTVRDPWAHLIVAGEKRIENRTWSTRYRGPVWIHSGAMYDERAFDWCRGKGIELPDPDDLPGGIIGQVELIDCVPVRDLPTKLHRHWSAEGPVCWIVNCPERLKTPIDCRGKLGLWRF